MRKMIQLIYELHIIMRYVMSAGADSIESR